MFIFRKISPWGLLLFGSDFQKINWRSQEVLNLDQSEPNFDFDFSDFDFRNIVNTGPEFTRSSNGVPMAFTAESPPAQCQWDQIMCASFSLTLHNTQWGYNLIEVADDMIATP